MADSTALSFTISNKGKPMLVYSGYVYRLKKSTMKVKYWMCRSNSCVANVHTDLNDHFIKAKGHHQHMPAPEHIELRNLKNKVKDRIQRETISVSKIYEEELARSNLSAIALSLTPLTSDTKYALNRLRKKNIPPLPTSSDFNIPDCYRQTLNGEPFICTDKLIENKRMILFATDKQLETLFSSEWIFLDGTFDACPAPFKQIYTIHSCKFNQNFPCIISLLSEKSIDMYQQLFSELEYHAKRLKMVFKPYHIMSDFEISLIEVIEQKFPTAIHYGCFFHYCQSLYKQLQSLGLLTAYVHDEDIRFACRNTMALAFLPVEHIEGATALLKKQSPTDMAEFFKYFEWQWLKRIPPKYWSVLTFELHTINYVEIWHNKFNNRMNKHHANIWHLFEYFQREEISFRQQLSKQNSSMRKKLDNKSWIIRTQMEALIRRYEQQEINILELLRKLSSYARS